MRIADIVNEADAKEAKLDLPKASLSVMSALLRCVVQDWIRTSGADCVVVDKDQYLNALYQKQSLDFYTDPINGNIVIKVSK